MSFAKIKSWLGLLALLALAACGGGGSSTTETGTPVLTPGSGTSGGSTTTLSLAVQLLDSNGAATTALVAGQPIRAQALLVKNGVAVANEIVQFALVQPAEVAKIDPVSGSMLTGSDGKAVVTLSSLGTSAGAGRITATATVNGTQVTGSANFFASGSVTSQPGTLTLSAVSIGSATVSAYGTTSVEVTVLQDGAAYTSPVTVNFTSSCASGRATITSSAATQPNGKAVATFVDNGCAQTADSTVTITATIGTDTKSGTMTVKAPTAGSLRFVSASPSDKSITLRGQGGNGRQENAQLTFKLVDVAGQGVANADVCFDATTYVGGLNLDGFLPSSLPTLPGSTAICGSDNLSVVRYVKRTNADGTVTIQINSGTVPTPVRVRARTLYPASASAPLETYSDTLSISTGLPLQRSFSLSVDKANIDGGNFDGEIATLTVRLADQFSNPVPDGTVVNFVGSGAAVCTADNGSCRTTNGACSCNVVSQNRRPLDNRVVVTAYAVGLEDFDDNNGTNLYDSTPLPADTFYDLGDAYVDANKDGVPNSLTVNGDTDILIPFQSGTSFRALGDGVRGPAHIRASTVIYLSMASGSGQPTIVIDPAQLHQERSLSSGSLSDGFLKLRPICPEGMPVPQATLSFTLEDGWGNPMASGTTLTSTGISANISTPNGFRPGAVLALGARPPSPSYDLPNTGKASPWSKLAASGNIVTGHSVTVSGVENKCSGDGDFALEIKSPRGAAANALLLLDGESRPLSGGRGRFDVRFRDSVNFTLSIIDAVTRQVEIGSPTLVLPYGSAAPVGITINWGDGNTTVAAAGSRLTLAERQHVFAQGNYNVRITVVDASGETYSNTVFISVP